MGSLRWRTDWKDQEGMLDLSCDRRERERDTEQRAKSNGGMEVEEEAPGTINNEFSDCSGRNQS
jgi:hypothetical protein